MLICIAVVSCGTSKKARQSLHETTAETTQTDVRVEVKQTAKSKSQTVAEASKSESEDTRRIELEFDTTKPVDSATGTPPIKRVTVTDNRRNTQTDARQQTATAAKQRTEVAIQDRSHMNAQTEKVVTQETEKKSCSLWWLWLIAGAMLAGLAVWAWRRYKWKL
ncbi:MAG: hypothetical protein LIO68_04285 [Rikenellaceae bacterium]|nr:hypothetical protein [Rikenellaceae bacterium]